MSKSQLLKPINKQMFQRKKSKKAVQGAFLMKTYEYFYREPKTVQVGVKELFKKLDKK
jgi:hypothetical protein